VTTIELLTYIIYRLSRIPEIPLFYGKPTARGCGINAIVLTAAVYGFLCGLYAAFIVFCGCYAEKKERSF
jgi:hypothetical protein